MNFLVPLYIAAASAVMLPVIFHLIRRTPARPDPLQHVAVLASFPTSPDAS